MKKELTIKTRTVAAIGTACALFALKAIKTNRHNVKELHRVVNKLNETSKKYHELDAELFHVKLNDDTEYYKSLADRYLELYHSADERGNQYFDTYLEESDKYLAQLAENSTLKNKITSLEDQLSSLKNHQEEK